MVLFINDYYWGGAYSIVSALNFEKWGGFIVLARLVSYPVLHEKQIHNMMKTEKMID